LKEKLTAQEQKHDMVKLPFQTQSAIVEYVSSSFFSSVGVSEQ